MIVDIHAHTFPPAIAAPTVDKLMHLSHTQAFTDGTVKQLRQSMARSGIDYALVLPVATNIRQMTKINQVSAQLHSRWRETGILSFGCMHPDFPDWKAELAHIKELGMPGVKLHPVYQGVNFDDPRFLRILDRAAELGLMVLCHGGGDVGFPDRSHCTPDMVLHAVKEVGDFPLIMAHMGGWHCWDQVEELLTHTKVCIDTAYCLGQIHPLDDGFYRPEDLPMMSTEQFVRMVRGFGADRVFWGTDTPWRDQQESLDLLRAQPLTDGEKAALLGGNAQKLLRLPERIPSTT